MKVWDLYLIVFAVLCALAGGCYHGHAWGKKEAQAAALMQGRREGLERGIQIGAEYHHEVVEPQENGCKSPEFDASPDALRVRFHAGR